MVRSAHICSPQNESYVYPHSIEEGPDIVTDDNGVRGRWIESDLPDALRIWKPRDARFVPEFSRLLNVIGFTDNDSDKVPYCYLARGGAEHR